VKIHKIEDTGRLPRTAFLHTMALKKGAVGK